MSASIEAGCAVESVGGVVNLALFILSAEQAELALIKGLEPFGFRDAFRAVHGYERRDLSWQWQRWGGGYRLDHLIVSKDVEVPQIEYLHDWRQQAGLSDHSPLLATLEFDPIG